MFSVSPEIYDIVFPASRWLFAFFALVLLVFAFSWHHADRRERKNRFKGLPGAGTVGELVVLSGSKDLPPDTWFPVPREGVLGSLRACDLVIPCPGVRSQHLDFSWQDGTGLLIRPRAGCEVLVDGTPVTRRGAWADAPLIHGSTLQVGTAVLRLQLFAALSHTSRVFTPQAPSSVPDENPVPFMPQPRPPVQVPPAAMQPWPGNPYQPQPQAPAQPFPPQVQPVRSRPAPVQPLPEPEQPVTDQPDRPQQAPAVPRRRRRTEPWKEDWSE